MRLSIFISGGVAVAAIGWILSGHVSNQKQSAHAVGAESSPKTSTMLPRVRVRTSVAQSWRRKIVIRGRTEAFRTVTLRAETPGSIKYTLVREGRRVTKGQALVKIDQAERTAALSEAIALIRQRTLEYEAANALARKGYRSDTKLAEARAHLDGARAHHSQIMIDLARTTIIAPFNGILEKRFVELGDYVKIGDNVARIVDLDPIIVVGAVSEREIDTIKVGRQATATLVDGRQLSGVIQYIGAVAEVATRTFRVEIVTPNPKGAVRDGITSEIHLLADEVQAHFLPSSLLTLNEVGQLGIKGVNDSQKVIFFPIKILSERPNGIWIDGLPERATLISVGQEFVRTGEQIQPVADYTERAS